MSTQTKLNTTTNTQTRGEITVSINLRPQTRYLSINGVVHVVPEDMTQMEFAQELRSGQ